MQKGWILCQEVTVQAQLVKDQVQVEAKAWGVVRVEAEWVGLSPQGQAVIASARTAAQQSLMLPDSLVIKGAVQSAEQK